MNRLAGKRALITGGTSGIGLETAQRFISEGAEVLVNLSNDAWFGDPEPALQQLEIASLRAVENRRYLVRAASTGSG